MKQMVWKKRFIAIIGDMILITLIPLPLFIIFASIGLPAIIIFPIIIGIILTDIRGIFLMRHEGSIISLEENDISVFS